MLMFAATAPHDGGCTGSVPAMTAVIYRHG